MPSDKPTFSIKTLGCKVNQYESQLIREQFVNNGFTEVDGEQPADAYIINTCTVTHHADSESRYFIRHAHRANPKARIIVTGCYVERDADTIAALEGVTDIIRNCDKETLISRIFSPSSIFPSGEAPLRSALHLPSSAIHQNAITAFANHSKAFVKIQDGCDNFCSYCKVPLVRGRSRSRPINDITAEVATLLEAGFHEIVLCGICLGAWGKDIGNTELADVLDAVTSLPGSFRIRLSSLELKTISDRLLGTIAGSSKICNHLHIPLQSGDDVILRRMNRPYTRAEYLAFTQKARAMVPGLGITTDVLVGFPGEEEDCFNNTLSAIEASKPHRVHIFSYSKREGTRAAGLGPSVPAAIVKKRTARMRDLVAALSYEYRLNFLNREVEVLIEEHRQHTTKRYGGYTDTYIEVFFDHVPALRTGLVPSRIHCVTPQATIAYPI